MTVTCIESFMINKRKKKTRGDAGSETKLGYDV